MLIHELISILLQTYYRSILGNFCNKNKVLSNVSDLSFKCFEWSLPHHEAHDLLVLCTNVYIQYPYFQVFGWWLADRSSGNGKMLTCSAKGWNPSLGDFISKTSVNQMDGWVLHPVFVHYWWRHNMTARDHDNVAMCTCDTGYHSYLSYKKPEDALYSVLYWAAE